MRKTFVIFTALIIFASCCSNSIDNVSVKIEKYLKDTQNSYRICMVIPNAGCGGCISEAESFVKSYYKRHDVLFIFTSMMSSEALKYKLGKSVINSANVIFDKDSEFVDDSDPNHIYPAVYFIKNGRVFKTIHFSPFEESPLAELIDFMEDEAMYRVDLEDYLNHPHKDKLSLAELLDTLIYIPLKTPDTLPVGQLVNVKRTDKHIGCYDRYDNLFLFDSGGNFITKIGAKGSGPGEFLAVADFSLSEKEELVSVYDVVKRKVHIYSLNGEYIKSVNYPENASALLCWNDSIYVGYMPWYEERERIVFYDAEMRQIDSFYPERGMEEGGMIDLYPIGELGVNGDVIQFRLALDNCSYFMGSTTAVMKNTGIILGKYQAPIDVETQVAKFNENINGPYVLGLRWTEVNGNVFMQYLYQGAYHRLVYRQQDGLVYYVDEGKYPSGIENKENQTYSFWPSWTDGEYAIGFIEAEAVEGEWEQYDNPVLMLGKLK